MQALDNMEFTQPVRCYNGAYDSASQRVLDTQADVLATIKRIEPEAHCTYFPSEGIWHVHAWGRPLSEYHKSKGSALADAYRRLVEVPPKEKEATA